MSNASLKEQLQAVASQLGEPKKNEAAKKKKFMIERNKKPIEKSKAPKPNWLEYVQYGVELLKVYFPNAFKNLNEVKPLKKGIKQDLLLRLSTLTNVTTDDKACMVKSLSYYVNTFAYHKTVLVGAVRIDLDGQEAGTVTAEEAKYSLEKLEVKQKAKAAKSVLNKDSNLGSS